MLNAAKIESVFVDCLYSDEELKSTGFPPKNMVKVEGITSKFGFNPKKIEKHRQEIHNFIQQLLSSFNEGCSFINMSMDIENHLWGEQRNSEQLLTLGLAIDELDYCLPKPMWLFLPGHMPYVEIKSSVSSH